MPALPLRHKVLPALLAVAVSTAVTTVSLAGPAIAAPSSDAQAATKAGGWLAGHLSHLGTVVDTYTDDKGNAVSYTDWGRTLDSALALLSAGGQDDTLGRTLTSIESAKAVADYTQGAPGDKADAAYVGATAKLAFLIALTGGDPTKVGGVDLVAQLTSLETSNGRFADRSSFGDYANVFGHAFALLALKQAGQPVPDAVVQGLLSVQCSDGAFPEGYPTTTSTACEGSVDATGVVLQALAAVGQGTSQQAGSATSWLSSQQKTDGSFPSQAPVNSTGYAVLGLDAVGASTGNAIAYLTGQQNADGGLRTGTGTDTTSNLFATAQATPALAGKTFTDAGRAVTRQATLTLATTHIVATQTGTVVVQAPPSSVVDLYAYSRPSTTFRVVRSATVGSSGVVTWTVSPVSNTRLYAQTHGGAATPQEVLNVATALSLSVSRTGTRTYVFSGHSIPARSGGLVISLYRVVDATHRVLTAQARASASSGNWSLTRVFSGTGQFGFVVRTGSDLQNAAGISTTRTVRIY